MTGFNHFSDCTCGWCVNYGRSGWSASARQSIELSYRQAAAESELRRSGIRSLSSCFVNPNASCPECGDRVYFYANRHRSRVFFDHLGPPWPKHPCTDRGRAYSSSPAPQARSRGQAHELMMTCVEAGRTSRGFGQRRPEDWSPVKIVSARRDGDRHTVVAEHLNSTDRELATVWYEADRVYLEEGDLANLKGDEISFFDMLTFQPIILISGKKATLPLTSNIQKDLCNLRKVPAVTMHIVARGVIQKAKSASRPRDDLAEKELKHFHSHKIDVASFCKKYMSIIRTYSREGVRKPREVSKRLNKDGHRTACGALWDARLVYFLLRLLFNDRKITIQNRSKESKKNIDSGDPTKTNVHKLPIAKSENKALTVQNMRERLSNLGRVTVRGS